MDVNTKKVLYISYDGMTDQLGQSQVIPYLRELSKTGYSFHILSVEKKERLAERGEMIRSLLAQSGIQWTTLPFSKRPPFLSKLYDQWKLNRTALHIARREKMNLLHCRSYVPAAAGLKVLKRLKTPFLFDMRGFWVDERVDSGLWNLKNPLYRFLYKLYKKKEKKYFSSAAHIISLTHKGKEELVSHYNIPAEKISVIPCCTDLDHFDYKKISDGQKNTIREKLNISTNAKVLSYLGSLGGWYMTSEMLDFYLELKKTHPELIFLFITPDSAADVFAKAAARGIAENEVRVIQAGRNEVPGLLAISDWNIFFIRDAYSKKASSPTKQGEVMAMGIPLICNDIGDTGKIIKESGAGVLVTAFSEEGYKKACDELDRLTAAPERIRESSCRYYDLSGGVEVYKKVYSEIIH